MVEKYDLDRYEASADTAAVHRAGGSFANKSYASNLMKKRSNEEGLDAPKADRWKHIIQCGVFSEKKNAEALVK